jgi:hypothetical protein
LHASEKQLKDRTDGTELMPQGTTEGAIPTSKTMKSFCLDSDLALYINGFWWRTLLDGFEVVTPAICLST